PRLSPIFEKGSGDVLLASRVAAFAVCAMRLVPPANNATNNKSRSERVNPVSSFVICHSSLVIHTGAMLDIRLIREKPDFVRERLATRGGGDEAKIDEVLRIDAERRKSATELQRLQSERNRLSKEIGARRSRKEPTEELEAEVRKIGEQITSLTQRANTLDEEQRNLLLDIPNLPHASVPIGKDPSANRIVRSWGEKPQLTNAADHVALGTRLNLFNLEWAAKLSGSGFICFTGAGAKLERALINFMIDLHT